MAGRLVHLVSAHFDCQIERLLLVFSLIYIIPIIHFYYGSCPMKRL
jgi:hypothetical protein